MNGEIPAYGLGLPGAIDSAVFIIFAFGVFKPRIERDRLSSHNPLFLWLAAEHLSRRRPVRR